jgi:RsmE family RNA methyltransferase
LGASKNNDRWPQILIRACEQCQHKLLPQFAAPIQISDWLHQRQFLFCITATVNAYLPIQLLCQHYFIFGLEGGLNQSEFDQALAKNFNTSRSAQRYSYGDCTGGCD